MTLKQEKMKVYGKQIICVGCKRPLVAKVLLDVYSEDLIRRPHLELICEGCGYGNVFEINNTRGVVINDGKT